MHVAVAVLASWPPSPSSRGSPDAMTCPHRSCSPPSESPPATCPSFHRSGSTPSQSWSRPPDRMPRPSVAPGRLQGQPVSHRHALGRPGRVHGSERRAVDLVAATGTVRRIDRLGRGWSHRRMPSPQGGGSRDGLARRVATFLEDESLALGPSAPLSRGLSHAVSPGGAGVSATCTTNEAQCQPSPSRMTVALDCSEGRSRGTTAAAPARSSPPPARSDTEAVAGQPDRRPVVSWTGTGDVRALNPCVCRRGSPGLRTWWPL